MLTKELVEFVNTRADTVLLGLRDARLVPSVHRALCVRASDDGASVSVVIASHATGGMAERIGDNGRAAVTLHESPTHETFQLKGQAGPPTELTDADRAAFAAYKERFFGMSEPKGVPRVVLDAYFSRPAVAITIAIEEVFLQTPGPGAGARVLPEPD